LYSLSQFWAVAKYHKQLFLLSFATSWFILSVILPNDMTIPNDVIVPAFSVSISLMIIKTADLWKNYNSLNPSDKILEIFEIAVSTLVIIIVFYVFVFWSDFGMDSDCLFSLFNYIKKEI